MAEAAVRLTRWAECAGCAAKLDARLLGDALDALGTPAHPRILVGLATRDDAGVYQLSEDLALVQTVDFFPPVVDDPFDFGRIAAANALSDVYAMGARPVTAMNLVGFPADELPAAVLHAILRGAQAVLDEAGVALIGGHSIVDKGVKFGLAVTGTVDPHCLITNAGARPGDVLVLTKPLGVGIIATAAKHQRAPRAAIAAATAAMTRLNRAAAEAMRAAGADACTDITGYGLLGHALEMAEASGVTLVIDQHRVPHFAEALALLRAGTTFGGLAANRGAFGDKVEFAGAVAEIWRDLLLDPQTSGGLLVALPAAQAGPYVARLHAGGDPAAAVIGRVEAYRTGAQLRVQP